MEESDGEFSMKMYEAPKDSNITKHLPFNGALCMISPSECVLHKNYWNLHRRFQDFSTDGSDVWVVSYPKAGTTWTQELVWVVLMGLHNERGKLVLMKRFPFYEWDSLIDDLSGINFDLMADDDPCKPGVTWKYLQSLPAPRTIKSHLPKLLLPTSLLKNDGAKVVYVCRDPRDVCVSYFYHYIKFEDFKGEFSDFVELFLADLLLYSPFWPHVIEYWKIRDEKNVLFLRYEELKADLSGNIEKVAKFLGRSVSSEDLHKFVDHLSFSSMKNNVAVNNENILANEVVKDPSTKPKFMRKGQVGDWKNHLTKEQEKAFKLWTLKHVQGTDFPYYQDYE